MEIMNLSSDFGHMLEGYVNVSVNVIYYMPDHKNVLNEFIWSTLDKKPKYPRIQKFLSYWEDEIQAKIKQVIIVDGVPFEIQEWRNGIIYSV